MKNANVKMALPRVARYTKGCMGISMIAVSALEDCNFVPCINNCHVINTNIAVVINIITAVSYTHLTLPTN